MLFLSEMMKKPPSHPAEKDGITIYLFASD